MSRRQAERCRESGFTLVEALVAMLMLTFGLIAITNLFIVAASSNTVANHSTVAAAQAAEVMERLKSVDFNALVVGGDLDADVGTPDCDPDTDANRCLGAGNYNMRRVIEGVGFVEVRWLIVDTNAAGAATYFIAVRAWSDAPLAQDRSQAEFTTFRACTMGTLCP